MKQLLTFIFAILFALAGNAQTAPPVPVATQAALTVASASDPDGSIASYSWKQVSGPAAMTITNANLANTMVTGYSKPGTYVYEVTVTDNQGATGKDTQTHVVLPSNLPPVVKAGATATIQLPAN